MVSLFEIFESRIGPLYAYDDCYTFAETLDTVIKKEISDLTSVRNELSRLNETSDSEELCNILEDLAAILQGDESNPKSNVFMYLADSVREAAREIERQ